MVDVRSSDELRSLRQRCRVTRNDAVRVRARSREQRIRAMLSVMDARDRVASARLGRS